MLTLALSITASLYGDNLSEENLVAYMDRFLQRLPTAVFWSGEFHGLYSSWGHKQSDMTERLSLDYNSPY